MRQINVSIPGRSYDILIAPGLLAEAGSRCRGVLPKAGRILLVTDTNVAPLYAPLVERSLTEAGFGVRTAVVPAGETSKNPEQLQSLWNQATEFGMTRSDAVVALGGGVVGDLAGFASATILRGIPFIQIPTTLLAQVDSSVGGKVGIDLPAGKNLAGAFWQPRLVLMDPDTLKTLPDSVFADGMAEVIKYGCIRSEGFFRFLEACGDRKSIMEHIDHVLHTCCAIKAEIVEQDERDTGVRMLLNFGHTLGHAYEAAYHYRRYTHGQAVAAGMVLAAEIGESLGKTERGTSAQLRVMVSDFGLPEEIECSKADYEKAIGLDKKGSGGEISLILLSRIGEAAAVKMDKSELLALL